MKDIKTPNLNIHLHPDGYESEETSAAGSAQASALMLLRDSFEEAAKGKRAIAADETMTEQGRLLAMDRLYEAKVEKLREKAWGALLMAEGQLAEVEAATNALLAPSQAPHELSIASEIRSVLRSLPLGERLAMIEAAKERGDRATISAAIHGPSYLTGLDPETVEGLRDLYVHRHHPVEFAALEASRKVARMAKLGAQEASGQRMRSHFFSHAEEALIAKAKETATATAKHLH